MNPVRRGRSRAAFLAAATALACATQAAPALEERALIVGSPLPALAADALDGRAIELPRDELGHRFVLVLSFSREAADPSRLWGSMLGAAYGPGVPIYAVPVLASVPRLFRGLVVASIRDAVAPGDRGRVIPLFDGSWRERCALRNAAVPVIIGVGANGAVVALVEGMATAAGLVRFRAAFDTDEGTG